MHEIQLAQKMHGDFKIIEKTHEHIRSLFMNRVSLKATSLVIGLGLLAGCNHVKKEPVIADKIAAVEASQTNLNEPYLRMRKLK